MRLTKLLEQHGIKHKYLHNAGNDARYTMHAFLAQCGVSSPCEPTPDGPPPLKIAGAPEHEEVAADDWWVTTTVAAWPTGGAATDSAAAAAADEQPGNSAAGAPVIGSIQGEGFWGSASAADWGQAWAAPPVRAEEEDYDPSFDQYGIEGEEEQGDYYAEEDEQPGDSGAGAFSGGRIQDEGFWGSANHAAWGQAWAASPVREQGGGGGGHNAGADDDDQPADSAAGMDEQPGDSAAGAPCADGIQDEAFWETAANADWAARWETADHVAWAASGTEQAGGYDPCEEQGGSEQPHQKRSRNHGDDSMN